MAKTTTGKPSSPPKSKAPVKDAASKTTEKAAPKSAAKKVSPPKPGAAPNALQQPLQPTAELAAVVGAEPIARGEVVSRVWAYIKKNDLQNPQNKREILADDTLKKVFGRDKVTMFEMNKYIAQHLK